MNKTTEKHLVDCPYCQDTGEVEDDVFVCRDQSNNCCGGCYETVMVPCEMCN